MNIFRHPRINYKKIIKSQPQNIIANNNLASIENIKKNYKNSLHILENILKKYL